MSPPELIAHKVIAYHARRGQPKAGTDWRDLAMLLLTFPELKKEKGPRYRRGPSPLKAFATQNTLAKQKYGKPESIIAVGSSLEFLLVPNEPNFAPGI